MASSRGHQACIQFLLECTVSANGMLDDQDKWGNTALHLAVRKRHAQVGKMVGRTGSIEKELVTAGGGGIA